MSAWSDFYLNRVGDGYPLYCFSRYYPFIELIRRYRPFSVIDEGCGIGTFCKIARWLNPGAVIHGVDYDSDILRLAGENLRNHNVRLNHADIRYYRPEIEPDLIFSHGVLEHYGDRDIRHILYRQTSLAREAVIHYVPLSGWNRPSFGDERLLPAEYWLSHFQPHNYILFNHNRDLILVWNKPAQETI